MILPQSRWEQVLKWFSDDEKLAIHEAVTGQPAMQKGVIVDDRQLTAELRAKLKFHFEPKATRADVAWRGGAA
jgi:hypothetical protein